MQTPTGGCRFDRLQFHQQNDESISSSGRNAVNPGSYRLQMTTRPESEHLSVRSGFLHDINTAPPQRPTTAAPRQPPRSTRVDDRYRLSRGTADTGPAASRNTTAQMQRNLNVLLEPSVVDRTSAMSSVPDACTRQYAKSASSCRERSFPVHCNSSTRSLQTPEKLKPRNHEEVTGDALSDRSLQAIRITFSPRTDRSSPDNQYEGQETTKQITTNTPEPQRIVADDVVTTLEGRLEEIRFNYEVTCTSPIRWLPRSAPRLRRRLVSDNAEYHPQPDYHQREGVRTATHPTSPQPRTGHSRPRKTMSRSEFLSPNCTRQRQILEKSGSRKGGRFMGRALSARAPLKWPGQVPENVRIVRDRCPFFCVNKALDLYSLA